MKMTEKNKKVKRLLKITTVLKKTRGNSEAAGGNESC